MVKSTLNLANKININEGWNGQRNKYNTSEKKRNVTWTKQQLAWRSRKPAKGKLSVSQTLQYWTDKWGLATNHHHPGGLSSVSGASNVKTFKREWRMFSKQLLKRKILTKDRKWGRGKRVVQAGLCTSCLSLGAGERQDCPTTLAWVDECSSNLVPKYKEHEEHKRKFVIRYLWALNQHCI